jgi:ribosomal protein L3
MFHRAPGFDRRFELSLARLSGMRMAGQMGNEQVTVRNLEVSKWTPRTTC